jgi:hypothetical protein
MAKTFKVNYKTRFKLQRAIEQFIVNEGLTDSFDLKRSIRVSSTTGDLNKLYITINALYYYMFLDQGANLDNGGSIAPFNITRNALNSPLGKEFQKDCVDAYVAWMMENYPILDVGKILVDNLKVEVKYNLYGDESGKWNGVYNEGDLGGYF